MTAILYSSSVRQVPISETLKHAKTFSRKLGITRVTDVTRLDRVGIPVFCSIRPGAQPGSLCVNAGKGLTEEEAKAGAFMEAIEFAMAEFGASSIHPFLATPRDLDGDSNVEDAILDFCPLKGKIISTNAPLQCIEAEEILTATRCLVPAQLIYLPFPRTLPGIRSFGSSSNGLCSGNSVLEASIHGIAEVIERDISAFQMFRDTSCLLLESSYPEMITTAAGAIRDAGLKLFVRYFPNEFGVPFFKAVVCDLLEHNPIYVSAGFGCHVDRNISLSRAVCEALQSRLSFIHGGRDDLTKRYDEFRGWDQARIHERTNYLIQRAASDDRIVSFDEVPSPCEHTANLQTILEKLVEALNRSGFHRICRVILTVPDDPLHVIRIIIPGLESFDPLLPRVGRRLANYVS